MDEDAVKRPALLVATVASFLTPFMGSSVNLALEAIEAEFAMDAVVLSWVQISYLLASVLFLVPFGKIADIHGRKKIFTYGIVIFTLSSFLSAVSVSVPMFLASRIIQGLGSAMIFGTGVAILTSVFPLGERGRALGINVAAVYLGLTLGPLLGGILTHHFGWRSIFFIIVPLGMMVIFLVFWKLKGEWADARGESFDLRGSVIYAFTIVNMMYGLYLLPGIWGGLLILVGVAGIIAFIYWETKVENPVLDIGLFRENRVFSLSNLAALIHYSATFAVSFLMSLYLQKIKGFNPQDAGLVLAAQPVVMTVFSPMAGRLSDRIEPRLVASIGMAITTLALLLFTVLAEDTSLNFIITGLLVLGFGFALFSSPNTNAIMSSVEKRSYGIASGMVGTMRLMGQMLSMGIAMLLFAVMIGRVEISPEYYPRFLTSVKAAFSIFTALCFGGIFASLARGKLHAKKT